MAHKFENEKYYTQLREITKFFEDFDCDIEERVPKDESRILCKDFYFLRNQWQLARTELKIAKVDPSDFLNNVLALIKRFKNVFNGNDFLEMDNQLIKIYLFLQEKYIRLRGDEYGALWQKRKDACSKGGVKSSSIYAPQKKEAEMIYIEYKKENKELIASYNQCQKKRKPNKPITVLKKMLLRGIRASISDDTALRWAKNLLKTNGILIITQQAADTGLKEK